MSTSPLHLRPPFRAEHIGSLLRPAPLLEKHQLLQRGHISPQDLKDAEDEAVKEVVRIQREAGMRTVTDGEQRRNCFYDGIFEVLEGMTTIYRPVSDFKLYMPAVKWVLEMWELKLGADSIFCNGKIKRTKPFFVESFKYLKSLVPAEEVKYLKVTMPSPALYYQRHGSDFTYDLSVYNNDDEYFEDMGRVYREEMKDLYDLGCRHIQIDDPILCTFCSDDTISKIEKEGVDPTALLDTYIHAINLCTQGRPHDLTIGVHVCRGNAPGGLYFTEGGYGRIAVKLFNSLDVDTFYLEYDTDRAGDFSPLKELPSNKVAVLGLVTTKSPKLETVADIKARVEEAVDAMTRDSPERSREAALNQLCISTQCGFASVWQGNPVTVEDEKKKLSLLVHAAKQIWSDQTIFRREG